jgi:hypothetical protein
MADCFGNPPLFFVEVSMKHALPIFVFVCSIIAFSPAAAQSDGSDFLTEVSLASTNNIVVGRMNDIAMQETLRSKRTTRQAPALVPANRNIAKFTASKARTQQNLNALVQNMRKRDPSSGDQMAKLVASKDIIGAVNGVLDRFGLERNNVAHAYALYWVSYWALANNEHAAPSRNAIRAAAAQAERGFAATRELSTMTDTQKQAAAEEFMILAAIFDSTSEHAKSDPELATKASLAALEGSRKSGLELDKMTLTENGFVPAAKKRSDASDEVPGEEQALASVVTSSDNDLSTADLALIAAAGGAGLAGVFLFGKAMGKKV